MTEGFGHATTGDSPLTTRATLQLLSHFRVPSHAKRDGWSFVWLSQRFISVLIYGTCVLYCMAITETLLCCDDPAQLSGALGTEAQPVVVSAGIGWLAAECYGLWLWSAAAHSCHRCWRAFLAGLRSCMKCISHSLGFNFDPKRGA